MTLPRAISPSFVLSLSCHHGGVSVRRQLLLSSVVGATRHTTQHSPFLRGDCDSITHVCGLTLLFGDACLCFALHHRLARRGSCCCCRCCCCCCWSPCTAHTLSCPSCVRIGTVPPPTVPRSVSRACVCPLSLSSFSTAAAADCTRSCRCCAGTPHRDWQHGRVPLSSRAMVAQVAFTVTRCFMLLPRCAFPHRFAGRDGTAMAPVSVRVCCAERRQPHSLTVHVPLRFCCWRTNAVGLTDIGTPATPCFCRRASMATRWLRWIA